MHYSRRRARAREPDTRRVERAGARTVRSLRELDMLPVFVERKRGINVELAVSTPRLASTGVPFVFGSNLEPGCRAVYYTETIVLARDSCSLEVTLLATLKYILYF